MRDKRRHLDAEIERLAEIAGEHSAEPDAELHHDRPVKAEPGADALDLLRGGGVARHNRRRIAGRQAQQKKHQHRDDQQDRDRRGEPSGDELDQFFLMFQ